MAHEGDEKHSLQLLEQEEIAFEEDDDNSPEPITDMSNSLHRVICRRCCCRYLAYEGRHSRYLAYEGAISRTVLFENNGRLIDVVPPAGEKQEYLVVKEVSNVTHSNGVDKTRDRVLRHIACQDCSTWLGFKLFEFGSGNEMDEFGYPINEMDEMDELLPGFIGQFFLFGDAVFISKLFDCNGKDVLGGEEHVYEFPNGETDVDIYNCKGCGLYVCEDPALIEEVDIEFTRSTMFWRMVNIHIGAPIIKQYGPQVIKVARVFCIRCNLKLGFKLLSNTQVEPFLAMGAYLVNSEELEEGTSFPH